MMRTLLPALTFAALTATAALADDKPVLTVYTYDSFTADWGPGPKVEEAFEAKCECDLQWVALGDGVALLNRLKLEGADSKADVVLGLDTNLIVEAEATGLFARSNTDLSALNVPGAFKSDIWVPYDFAHFAVVYDSQAISSPPQSLAELVDGKGEGKIVLQDPRTSTPGLGFLLWMKAVYGDKAGEAWGRLQDRIVTITPGWSEAYGLFTQGEADMVLSYTTSPAYHLIAEETDRYKALTFAEGHTLQIEVSGRLKAAKEPELAEQFLTFTTSAEFQSIIPTTNWMMPTVNMVLHPVFDMLETPQTLEIAPEEVANNRKAWIAEWLAASSR
jgi:thiamine transport system substrate-binding protein